MAPPSKLAIATSSLQRLIKEEASYHKEAVQQEARIKKIEADESDENKEYILKQEQNVLKETQALFPGLKQQISGALQRLEEQLAASKTEGASEEDITKAETALESGKTALEEIS